MLALKTWKTLFPKKEKQTDLFMSQGELGRHCRKENLPA